MFDAYKKHLDILRELKLTNRTEDYICPICMHGFSKEEINKLSLEDVPQKALGGNEIAITCKKCNNTCGNTIDFHLVNFIEYKEMRNFLPGSDRKIRIVDLGDGKPIEATLKVNGKNDIKLMVHRDYFNSTNIGKRLKMLIKDKKITIQDKRKKWDLNIVSSAIIKNAYIILFSKLGYTLIFDDYYNGIRNQIQTPNISSLSSGIWTIQEKLPVGDGIYLSCDNRYRGFFVVYSILKNTSYRVMVYIPTPLINFKNATTTISDVSQKKGLCLKKIDTTDFLINQEKIKSLRKWIYSYE